MLQTLQILQILKVLKARKVVIFLSVVVVHSDLTYEYDSEVDMRKSQAPMNYYREFGSFICGCKANTLIKYDHILNDLERHWLAEGGEALEKRRARL